jgi:hypothetical protein
MAADLVRRKANVIVAGGVPPALTAKAATTTVPIAFQLGADPVRAGALFFYRNNVRSWHLRTFATQHPKAPLSG